MNERRKLRAGHRTLRWSTCDDAWIGIREERGQTDNEAIAFDKLPFWPLSPNALSIVTICHSVQ